MLDVQAQDLGIGRLFESVRDAVIVAEAETGRVVLWNPAATEIFGYSSSEALELNVADIVPERLKERHRAGMARYRETGHGPYLDSRTILDLPAVHKTGEEISVEMTLSPVEPVVDSMAEGRFVLAIIRDTTERKKTERTRISQTRQIALRAEVSEAFRRRGTLREVLRHCCEAVVEHLDAAFARVWILNEEENVLELEASAGMYRHLDGAHSRVPVGRFKIGLIAQERKPHLTNTVLTDPRVSDKEWARREGMVAFAGHPLIVEDRLAGVVAMFARHEFSGDATEALASVTDIIAQGIERKRAEERLQRLNEELEDRVAERTARLEAALFELRERQRKLREGEERYRAVIEQAGEGIFLFDAATKRILEANPAFQEMFGYGAEELARMRVYDLVPDDPAGVDRNVRRALEQKHLLVGERSYRRKDGAVVEVEVSGSVISYGSREVVCSVVLDVTERKRAERALREVREAERNRMARELHDGALQDISYASAEAEVIRVISEDPMLEDRLERMLEALQRGGRELRGAVLDLRLGEEQDRPFVRQLESLIDQNRKMSPGLVVRLEAQGDLPHTSFGDAGTELLRALQEALTNVRRHAGATNARLVVSVEGDDLRAEVTDDGSGFGTGTAPGIGFRSMRERMAALGGHLEVESEPGEGTRVCFRAPMSALLGRRSDGGGEAPRLTET